MLVVARLRLDDLVLEPEDQLRTASVVADTTLLFGRGASGSISFQQLGKDERLSVQLVRGGNAFVVSDGCCRVAVLKSAAEKGAIADGVSLECEVTLSSRQDTVLGRLQARFRRAAVVSGRANRGYLQLEHRSLFECVCYAKRYVAGHQQQLLVVRPPPLSNVNLLIVFTALKPPVVLATLFKTF